MKIRLPRHMDGSFTETGRLTPISLSLTLPLRAAPSAQMGLALQGPFPAVRDWVEIYTLKGSAGLYRVGAVSRDVAGRVSVTLRHGIDVLADSVWKEQRDFSGTVRQYLTALLAQQTRRYWQLGDCEDSSTWKKSGINYDRLDGLLWALAEERRDYFFAYDFSTTPWTLHFRALPGTVEAEFRMTRNVQGGKITEDDGEMFNRLYLSVNTRVPGGEDGVDTTQTEMRTYNHTTSQQLYGVVETCADIDTEDVADPDAWAEALLNEHAFPASQIPLDGAELVTLTGESWDEAAVGKLARLKGAGAVVEDRIVSCEYTDLVTAPESVTLEIANHLLRFSERLADLKRQEEQTARQTRSHGRGGASSKDLEHWSMVVKKQKEALDGSGVTEIYESGIVLDAEQGVKLYSLKDALLREYAEIVVNSGGIASLVQKTGVNSLGQNETLYSKVTQTATDITSLVQKTGVNSLGQNETLYSKVTQTAASLTTQINKKVDSTTYNSYVTQTAQEIATKVSAGNIASSINQTAQSVKIKASKIDLDGYVTASNLDAAFASFDSVGGSFTVYGSVTVGGRLETDGIEFQSYTVSWKSKTVVTSLSYQTISIKDGDGDFIHVGSVTDKSTSTIYYLGRS